MYWWDINLTDCLHEKILTFLSTGYRDKCVAMACENMKTSPCAGVKRHSGIFTLNEEMHISLLP